MSRTPAASLSPSCVGAQAEDLAAAGPPGKLPMRRPLPRLVALASREALSLLGLVTCDLYVS